MTPLHQGIELFNQEKFFEAHAVWEKDWLKVEEKRLYQGLIMIAAAFVHCQRGNLKYTEHFLAEGSKRLEAYKESGLFNVRLFLDSLDKTLLLVRAKKLIGYPKIPVNPVESTS